MTRVLLADDHQMVREGLRLILARVPRIEVVGEATTGLSTLELVHELLPDIVVMDIGMPDLNGYEVARRLRHSATGKKVRLIALTGWGQDEDKRRARDAGFDYHLTKPVDREGLDALLAE